VSSVVPFRLPIASAADRAGHFARYLPAGIPAPFWPASFVNGSYKKEADQDYDHKEGHIAAPISYPGVIGGATGALNAGGKLGASLMYVLLA
jgi:hypothetical protein